ncbi:MAG: SusD/RagB family nutrient-binding outer membrane lipoprotein [Cytophagales bacterium]|jgi:hypothetical protein|nr:SusD/RagB family nutrient-binding outer membrane lipoprotein [Cytophagales bacterium]
MNRLSIKTALLSLVVFALSACTSDFDAMNTDPNNPSNISPQFLLPTVIETSIDRYWGGRTRFERLNLDGTMLWMQYLARNIYSNEGDNYGVSPAFNDNNWAAFHTQGLTNAQRIITLSKEGGAQPNPNYEGVALVMRSWIFSLLTDMWGAVPYSEALKGTAEEPIYKPTYDSQEAVYAGLLNDLKLANEKLNPSGPAISGDILYNNNILAWKRFANSLRLRLANRQAAKKPAESKAIMAEILGDPAKFPVFTANTDNATLRHTATLPSNNEWHQVIIQEGRTDWNISKTLVDKLTALNDTRLAAFAQPVNGRFEGVPNGLPDAIATTYLGRASTLSTSFTRPDAPSVVMTYAELQFILAEAALDGDITGDAQKFFEDGIRASFAQFGATMPANYLTTIGAVTKEKLMEQKWIALFGQGVEAWTEYRRTGLPVLPPKDNQALFENDGVLPTRLRYPTTEEALNKENMTKGMQLNGGANDFKSKLWWAEK